MNPRTACRSKLSSMFVFALAAALLLPACGKKTSAPPSIPKPTQPPPAPAQPPQPPAQPANAPKPDDLTGTWISACLGTDPNLEPMASSKVYTWKFSDNKNIVWHVDYYNNADCTALAYTDDFNGTYVIGGDAGNGARNLDLNFDSGSKYTIFKIDNSTGTYFLYLGDDSGAQDGNSAGARPTTLYSMPSFAKWE